MKNLTPILFVLLFSLTYQNNLIAQYDINLVFSPNVSLYLSDWVNGNIDAKLDIFNPDPEEKIVALSITVYRDNTPVADSDQVNSESITFTIESGWNNVYSYDIFRDMNLEIDKFAVKDYNYVSETKQFPPGNYSICINLYGVGDTEIIPLMEKCFPLTIMAYQPPSIIFPEDETVFTVEELSITSFQWSGLVPFHPSVQYYLRVFEIFEGQTKEQAVMVNPVIWEQSTSVTTISRVSLDFVPLDGARKYAWQVQSVDYEDRGMGRRNGFSEVWEFEVVDEPLFQDIQETDSIDWYLLIEEPEDSMQTENCGHGKIAFTTDHKTTKKILTSSEHTHSHYVPKNHLIFTGHTLVATGGNMNLKVEEIPKTNNTIIVEGTYVILINSDEVNEDINDIEIKTHVFKNNKKVGIAPTTNSENKNTKTTISHSPNSAVYLKNMGHMVRKSSGVDNYETGENIDITFEDYYFFCIPIHDERRYGVAVEFRFEIFDNTNLSISDSYTLVTYIPEIILGVGEHPQIHSLYDFYNTKCNGDETDHVKGHIMITPLPVQGTTIVQPCQISPEHETLTVGSTKHRKRHRNKHN